MNAAGTMVRCGVDHGTPVVVRLVYYYLPSDNVRAGLTGKPFARRDHTTSSRSRHITA